MIVNAVPATTATVTDRCLVNLGMMPASEVT
jgi:hypothetical protein